MSAAIPTDTLNATVQRYLRQLQLNVAMACVGAGLMTATVVYLRWRPNGMVAPSRDMPFISYAATAFACAAFVGRLVIPAVFVAVARRRIAAGEWSPPANFARDCGLDDREKGTTAGQLCLLHRVRTMIAATPISLAAFFCGVAFYIEGRVWTLAVAGAFAVFLAFHIPTRMSTHRWLAAQARLVEEQRTRAASDS